MRKLVTTKLREGAVALRALAAEGATADCISSTKDAFLHQIYSILTFTLTPPPNAFTPFTWEYYDAKGAFHSLTATPLEFAGYLSSAETVEACQGTDIAELFSLVHDPRNPYGRLMTVDRLGNVAGGRPVTYVNVDMSTIKTAVIAMLRAGIPVFFGSDVGQFSDRALGIMDTNLHDYNSAFGFDLLDHSTATSGTGMSKADRLRIGESAMTHAMVLTAVHLDEATGNPIRWRVQNSWGEEPGQKGWFVMTDKWMDEFVYQVVVDPRFVPRDVREVLGQQPLVLPLWDPMGALA